MRRTQLLLLLTISIPTGTPMLAGAQEPLLRDFQEEECAIHLRRARVHLRADELAAALEDYQRGADECPEHARLLADYGWVLAQNRRFADALRVLGAANEFADSSELHAAILYSAGVAHEGLGHGRTSMQAYLGSLRLRESSAASRRAEELHRRFARQYPGQTPLGAEGRVQVRPVEDAWGSLSPCDHYAQNPAASEMETDSFRCEETERWTTPAISFRRVNIADAWASASEIWAEQEGRWLRVRAIDTSGGMLGGEYTTLRLEGVRTAQLGADSWFYADVQVTSVDYDYDAAWRQDHFSHWACRVGADAECVEIARGSDSFVGPGRCLYSGDCYADEDLVEADRRTLPVEERTARADVAVRWNGTRLRFVGRAAPPALRLWNTLDQLRAMANVDALELFDAELGLDGDSLSEADPVAAFVQATHPSE